MSENFIRHIVSLIGALVCGLAFFAGYVSGGRGWWWAVFSVIIIYAAIYKLVKV